jgi:hypothetical protein
MRKEIITAQGERVAQPAPWLDLTTIARVEITSEDDLFPIEHALDHAKTTGWRAAHTGPQTIRLRFDEPQELHRIQIHIIDRASERTQELALTVELIGCGRQEVLRQQFNFSPGGSTEELEDLNVELAHVSMLELVIDPDRAHVSAHSQNYATLTALRLS